MARQKGRGPNKTGTIYQDKAGKWWAQLPADDYGKRPKKSARTEAQAVILLAELEQERAQGLNPSERDPTLAQHLDAWLEISVRPNLKKQVFEDRRYFIDHYLKPPLGAIKLKKLTAAHIQPMLNAMLDRGLARSTVRMARRHLVGALRVAIEWKLLPADENAAQRTKIPREAISDDRDPLHRLTTSQAQTLLRSLIGHRFYAIYFLALTYGMRQAELVGLRWSDVDLEGRVLRIRSQVHRKRKEIRRTAPKTPKSRRTLLLDDATVAVLKAQAQRVHEERTLQQRAGKWKEHGLVFPSQVGTPLFGSMLWRHCQTSLRRAKLPMIPFHGLRHTAASMMLENGVALPDVSEILGHANPGVTAKLYLHGSDDGKRAAAETMTALLRRANS